MNAKELRDLFASGRAYVACDGERLIDEATAREADAIAARALGLLAAAEANDGSTPETDIATMVTLCRLAPNEAADAIESGDHNDSDIEAVIHWVRHFPDAATLIEALHSERNALAARVRELEPDAERYRWLREGKVTRPPLSVVQASDEYGGDIALHGECLDAAIDAARSK